MGDDADFGAADKANGATPAIAKRVHQIIDLTNVPDDDVAGATPLADRSEIVDQPVYVGMHEAGFVIPRDGTWTRARSTRVAISLTTKSPLQSVTSSVTRACPPL